MLGKQFTVTEYLTHQLGSTPSSLATTSADRTQLLSLMSPLSLITICCSGLFLPRVPRRPSRSFKLDRGGS